MNRNVGSKLHVHQGPFLVGVPRFMLRRPEFSKFPKHSIVVFLDKNEIRLMNTQKSVSDLTPLWPTEYKRRLQKVMEDAACVFTDTEQNTSKQRVFDTLSEVFKFMTHILAFTKSQKTPFTRRFAETDIFREFVTKYKQNNPIDKKLTNVYKYYMDNQKINFGFSMPARGTLAKIARSTEHYNTAFPTVNEKLVKRNETKHLQKNPNIRPKKRPKPDKCNQEALAFLNKTLLAPSKTTKPMQDSSGLSGGLSPRPQMKNNLSRRISVRDQMNNSRPKPVGTSVPEPASSMQSNQTINNLSMPSAEQQHGAEVLRRLEDIIQQAKNSEDLNAFQTHMEQIQELLSNQAQKMVMNFQRKII